MTKLPRHTYAAMYGPTTGDKVRLADTELFIEVEKDFTTYGEEVKFGGGKVIRDGMAAPGHPRRRPVDDRSTMPWCLTTTGIYKPISSVRNGRIDQPIWQGRKSLTRSP